MKIIAYHWSPERFEKFDNAYIGSTNSSTYLNGFYFANEPLKGTEGYLYKCELTINNPIEIDVSLSDWDSLGVQEAISALVNHGDWGYIKDYLVDNVEMDVEEAETLLEQWERADGAILTNVSYDYHTIEYIVFDANQIKILERTALEDEQASNVYETLNKLKENVNIFSKLNEQLAFHGSRAEFEKFNSDKIKEYRFGWGFYFTKSQSYASDYGNVKQYEIPDDEYLLDWESSYNYQSETVQNALYEIWQDIKEKDTELLFEKALFGDYCNNGYWIYHTLSEVLKISAKDTSLLLNKYGIKGIYSLEGNCIVVFNSADIRMSVTEIFKSLNEQLQKYLN